MLQVLLSMTMVGKGKIKGNALQTVSCDKIRLQSGWAMRRHPDTRSTDTEFISFRGGCPLYLCMLLSDSETHPDKPIMQNVKLLPVLNTNIFGV